MRCPGCNALTGYEDPPSVEVEDCDLDGKTLSGTARVVLCCPECGKELRETTFGLRADIDHECEERGGSRPLYRLLCEWDGSGASRVETHDRNGRPIRASRSNRTYYGGEFTATVKCLHCRQDIEVTVSEEAQARDFDRLR